MPVVQWSIDASGAEAGAAAFDRANQRIERSLRAVQTAQRDAQRSETEAGRLRERSARQLETLRSSLGGAERAAVQYARGERVISEALRQSNIDLVEATRLRALLAERTSLAAVNSRDLGLVLGRLSTGPLAVLAPQFAATANSATLMAASFGRLGAAAGPLLVGAALTAGFVGLASAAAKAAERMDDLDERARSLGASVEALQRLRFIGTLEGVVNIEGAITRLQDKLGDPSRKTEEALSRLGTSADALRRMDIEGQLATIARGFETIGNPALRQAINVELFGRGFARMLNVIGEGEGKFRSAGEEVTRLGGVLEESVVQRAAAAHSRFEALGLVFSATKDRLALGLLPALEAVGKSLFRATNLAVDFIEALDAARIERLTDRIRQLGEISDVFGGEGPFKGLKAGIDAKIEEFRKERDRLVEENLEARRKFTLGIGGGGGAGGGGGGGDLQDDIKDLHTYDAALKAALKSFDDLQRARERAPAAVDTALETQQVALEKMIARKEELENRATEKAQAKAIADAERAARAAQEPFLNAAEAIQDEISGALASAFRGGITDAEDFASAVLDIVARMAAEIATTKIFGGILEQIGQGGAGFGGIAGIFGGGPTQPTIAPDASREEIIRILEENRDAVLQTATNTGGMLGLIKAAGAGAAGIGLGIGAAGLFGLPTGIAGAAGGGLGALLGGVLGGPGGAAVGGGIGGFLTGQIGSFFKDLFGGRNPFGGQSRASGALEGAALGSVFPGFGTAIGAIIGSLLGGEGQKAQVQLRTSLTQTGFRAGISEEGPFGFVGIDAARSQGIKQSATRRFAQAVQAFDSALAAAIDPGLIDEVTTALINTRALRESAQNFDREFNSLLVDRAATVLRASLAGQGVAANIIDDIIKDTLSKSGSASRKPNEIIDTVTGLLEGFAELGRGRTELRGEDIAESTTALQRLRDTFQDLAPLATRFGVSLEELQEDLAAGEEALRRTFREDLATRTLALVDPFAAAIDAIAQEEQRLARETAALGTGMAEAAAFIAASREDLAKRATAPTTALLDELALGQLGPAGARDLLGQRFTAALGGTDAGRVAETARALIEANEQFFGHTSLFFESQTFIQRSLETFNERIREQALSDTTAIESQTDTLAANQEEQTNVLIRLLAETQSQRAEIERLRADLSLVLSRLAKAG